MNKETVKKLLSSGSGEDQKLGLEYLQYLEDQEIEEIVPLSSFAAGGYDNHSKLYGLITLKNSILLLGSHTIIRYELSKLSNWSYQYKQLNKNLTPWQENQLIQQNQDK